MKAELKATVHEIVEQLVQDEATKMLDGLRQEASTGMTGIFYPLTPEQKLAAILHGPFPLMPKQQQSAPGKRAKRQAKA